MIEPPERHHTAAAIDFISKRLGLRNDPGMQDWEFEVAEASDLHRYLSLYDEAADKEDVRFTLADMIIQAFEESGDNLSVNPKWETFLETLVRGIDIHGCQIWYWACWDYQLDEAWNVTPFMRSLCETHFAAEK